MAEDPKPETTPAEEPKKETPAPEKTAPDEKPVGKDGTPFDPDRAQRALEAARENERKAKAEAKEAREKAAKYDELTEAQKSDLEKAVSRAEKAEAKAAEADGKLQRANLIAALAQPELGVVNARAAAKLIEGVEYDAEGEPTNLGDSSDENSLIGKFLADNDFLRGKQAKQPAPKVDARDTGDRPKVELTAEQEQFAEENGIDRDNYAALAARTQGGVVTLADAQALGTADKE